MSKVASVRRGTSTMRLALSMFLMECLLLASLVQSQSAGEDQDPGNSTDATTMAPLSCEAETIALNGNAEISDATQALLTDTKDAILEDFTQFCRIITLTCTADIADYSQELRMACEDAGGQLLEQKYELDCKTDTVSPIEIPGTVELLNIPACVGATCDPDDLPPSIQQIQDQLITNLNEGVDTALGDSVVCQVGISSSASSFGSSCSITNYGSSFFFLFFSYYGISWITMG